MLKAQDYHSKLQIIHKNDDSIDWNQVLYYKRFLYIAELTSINEVNNFKELYNLNINAKPYLQMLILTNNNNQSVIIFGTVETIILLRKLRKLYKFPWNCNEIKCEWQEFKYQQEILENINTNIDHKIKINTENIDKSYLEEFSCEFNL
ncbi:hypothetical protein ABK040_004957 [Willaertia magna]